MPAKKRHTKKKTVRKKKPSRRVGSKPKYKVYHEVKRVGKVRITKGKVSIGGLTIKQAKAQVNEKLAWELLAKDSARNSKVRNAAAKKIKALKQAQKRLSEL